MKVTFLLSIILWLSIYDNLVETIPVDAEIYTSLELSGEAEAFLILKDQADLSFASQIRSKESKGEYVFEALTNHNIRTQKNLVHWLEKENIQFFSMTVANGIFAKINSAALEKLKSRTDLKAITANPTVPLLSVNQVAETREKILGAWGISKVGADKLWEMGIEGQGTIVAGQDTGYDPNHPAIQKKYRGYIDSVTAEHSYNWHDAIHEIELMHEDSIVVPENNPCGLDANAPCDDHSHGTHTMGTMLGESETEIFGLAPKAEWIGCRCMERGYGTPFTYLECFEFFLAPTDTAGLNPNPSLAPHVINNSWGCPEIEGCNQSNFELIDIAINNLRAAGIVVVVSAGNGGRNGCSTVDDPPAIFDGSFAVGATDFQDTIAAFSSKGPVIVDGSMRMKPNISAPGVGIRSAVLGNGYASWSGTSMAGPHVAGAVALLISAVPELSGQVEAIETLLEQTAEPLIAEEVCGDIDGATIPNPVYGYGRLNILKAVEKALSEFTNIVDIPNNNEINIFPNPGSSLITISWLLDQPIQRIDVYNNLGQLILDYSHIASNQFQLSTSEFSPGVYWIQLAGKPGLVKKYIRL